VRHEHIAGYMAVVAAVGGGETVHSGGRYTNRGAGISAELLSASPPSFIVRSGGRRHYRSIGI